MVLRIKFCYLELVRDELAFRWRCLSKTFSQRDMVL